MKKSYLKQIIKEVILEQNAEIFAAEQKRAKAIYDLFYAANGVNPKSVYTQDDIKAMGGLKEIVKTISDSDIQFQKAVEFMANYKNGTNLIDALKKLSNNTPNLRFNIIRIWATRQ